MASVVCSCYALCAGAESFETTDNVIQGRGEAGMRSVRCKGIHQKQV